MQNSKRMNGSLIVENESPLYWVSNQSKQIIYGSNIPEFSRQTIENRKVELKQGTTSNLNQESFCQQF